MSSGLHLNTADKQNQGLCPYQDLIWFARSRGPLTSLPWPPDKCYLHLLADSHSTAVVKPNVSAAIRVRTVAS